MSDETRVWSDDEVVTYLQSVKLAVDEALDNLGVSDEVAGFSFSPSFALSAPAVSPTMLNRLGPRFTSGGLGGPRDVAADNGSCGFIC